MRVATAINPELIRDAAVSSEGANAFIPKKRKTNTASSSTIYRVNQAPSRAQYREDDDDKHTDGSDVELLHVLHHHPLHLLFVD